MEIVIERFAGKDFYLVLGGTPVVGTKGTLFQYTIYVQRGLGLVRADVASRIDRTLADKRGWIRGNVRFQRVEKGAGTIVFVADPETTDKLCAPLRTEGKVSCCRDNYVVINVDRWKTAVPHWTGSVHTYRQMLINHEMGHRIGHGHLRCEGAGKLAPVMQQQTYGLQGCKENSWPLDSEIR
jgi:hypothetical protein